MSKLQAPRSFLLISVARSGKWYSPTSSQSFHLRPISRFSSTLPLPNPSISSESALSPLPRHIPHTSSLLLIHLPIPPHHWPSVISKSSSVVFAIERAAARKGVRSLCVWDGKGEREEFEHFDTFEGVLWRRGKREGEDGKQREAMGLNEVVFLPGLKAETVGSREFEDILEGREAESWGEDKIPIRSVKAEATDILVCVHGSRDCRCSDHGFPLVKALREETLRLDASVRVLQCSHIGGHKFAANAILLPSGHLLGNLRASDASSVLDFHQGLLNISDSDSGRVKDTILSQEGKRNPMWDKYRGTFGLSEDEQKRLWEHHGDEVDTK